ncbi:Integrase [Paraburkholderia tropica]|uniref:tyrosine-type recombinase/integrase n=1 Tax=Paraburkholderia tropica TaxID=92647 RepID=UPI001CB188A6|nr:tyrosine-type recombinase/integrase [Paraburkholderia tropica]CAG9207749.1 Integrase [Paraburkholderia tropica]
MAKAPVIELHQVRHALKVAAVIGQAPLRDVALLAALYSTGVTPKEAAKLVVSDYLAVDGSTRVNSTLRKEIAFNGKARPLVWANATARKALDDYLRHRREARHGISTAPAAFMGLDPSSPLFLTSDGSPFTFTRRVTRTGAASYSCETLNEVIRRLHTQAGIENGSANAARRTFAVNLHRQGRSLKLIQGLIGVSSLVAVKRLVDGDPVSLASVVSRVI